MRAVARVQHDVAHVGFVAQLQQVLDRGSAKGVDRLVVVPHQRQLPVWRQQSEQLQLHRVDVLGLVYEHVPVPVTDEFVNPTTIDLILESDYLLDEVIELVKCMGLVFNPKFYLSIEDFHLEYAAEAFCDLAVLF